MVNIGNSWDRLLADQFESEYYKNLRQFLKHEYSHYTIYPHMNDIFNALRMTDYDSVRVVLLGQTRITVRVRRTACAFRLRTAWSRRPRL